MLVVPLIAFVVQLIAFFVVQSFVVPYLDCLYLTLFYFAVFTQSV
jgi:hypothetical protein